MEKCSGCKNVIQLTPLVDLSEEKWKKSEYHRDDNKIKLIYAGSTGDIKDDFLTVIKAVAKFKGEIELHILGVDKSVIAKKISKEEFDEYPMDDVIFHGRVSHEDMAIIYNIADVVVLPSVCLEACSLTTGEAVSCRKYVISTNIGGIPEMVGGYATLLDVNPFLTERLAEEIEDVLRDNVQLSNELVQEYRMNYSIHRYYNRSVEIINKVMER